MKPPIYVPQAYPIYVAHCIDWGRQDNPQTDEGRECMREHAGQSDQALQRAINVAPIIMWLISDEDICYPIPVTTGGTIEWMTGTGTDFVINIDPDVARADLLLRCKGARDQALQRCTARSLTPYGDGKRRSV